MTTMPKRTTSRRKLWMKTPERPKNPADGEKQGIISACETLIRDVLKPRYLSEVVPTPFNYRVDIRGAWAGGRYRFLERYRSGFDDNEGEEFDAPFARIDRIGPDQFNVYWMRHTGQWWRLHSGVTLAEALNIVETDDVLRLH